MQIRTTDDVKELGTMLCVFAHPDDETFTMGGIIAAARSNGQRVIVVTATRGEGGVQDESRWPKENLGETRTKELEQALKILGVEHHFYMGVADGSCAEVDADPLITRIARLIDTYQTDSIMTFGPDGLTGHPDHKTVSDWASKARLQAESSAKIYHSVQTTEQYKRSQSVDKALNFFYNTPEPPVVDEANADICLHLSDDLIETKLDALKAMPSQYQIMFERFGKDVISGCFNVEAFVRAEHA